MSQNPPNPHAFPRRSVGDGGMSLRDYLAGQALAGIMSNVATSEGVDFLPDDACREAVAEAAYRLADAMLCERGEDGQ